MDRWSLESLGVPIYPQDRFQVGVAMAVMRQSRTQAFVVTVQSMSDRFTGKRSSNEFTNRDALEKELGRFLVNADPGQSWR